MHGEYKTPGGKLVVVDLEVEGGRLARVQVSGDFFLEPEEALEAINGALEGLPQEAGEAEIAGRVRAALSPEVVMLGFSPQAIAVAVRRALA
jgi:lipoate-protein ligase A